MREHPATLARLLRRVDINLRGALIQVEHIHLILLLLQIKGGTIYETFISVQHEDSPEFIARMAAQGAFSIKESLYGRYSSVKALWQALGRRLDGIGWMFSSPSAN